MCKTDPIRNPDDIRRLKEYFLNRKKYRNYAMVALALNTSLRIGDLLHLKWDDVYNFKAGVYRGHIALTEQKTGKKNRIALNREAIGALDLLKESLKREAEGENFLFRAEMEKISPSTAHLPFE